MVLVGPSGCGKTTALRMVAGLEDISEGVLRIGETVVNHVPPRDRDIAMVFQSYALYPHLSVYDNIAFGLKLKKTPKAEVRERVQKAARAARARGAPRPEAARALRRPAPARGDGPRDRAPAEGVPHGRAALEPRREAARADARRDLAAPERPRRDDRLRHARPGRGDDDGRPRRGHAQGRAAAGGAAAGALRPAGQPLRRRLHRQPGDERRSRRRSRRENGGLVAVAGSQRIMLGQETPRRPAGARSSTRDARSCSGSGPRTSRTPRSTESREDQRLQRQGDADGGARLRGDGALQGRRAARARPRRSRELAKDAGAEGLTELNQDGRRDDGRPLRRALARQARRRPSRSRSTPAHCTSSSPRAGWGSMTGLKGRAEPDEKHTFASCSHCSWRCSRFSRQAAAATTTRPADDTAARRPTAKAADGLRLDHRAGRLDRRRRARTSRPCSTASRRRTRTSPFGTSPRRIPATVLSTSVEGGNPPDVAALPVAGHHGRLRRPRRADADRLRAGRRSRRTTRRSWLELGTDRGRAVRRLLQGRQQVDRLVQRCRVRERRRRAPEDWETFLSNAETLTAAGTPAYSIGGSDGWTLTDLFENIYLRTGGAGEVRPAGHARDPVDRPVGEGRAHRDGRRSSATRTTSPAGRAARCRPTSRPR